ncbi:universal stress protein, partial [Streptomyces calidiresistens]
PDPATVRCAVRRGPTAPIVAEELVRADADLLVLGAHGEHGLADLLPGTGSTAENLLRASPVPVLVVHRPAEADYRTVVLALDDGAASREAARRAGELTPDASHLALHVAVVPGEHLMRMRGVDDAELGRLRHTAGREARERIEAVADSLRPPPGRVVLTTGRPHERVPEWAGEHDAELIAVGTGTRTALGYTLLGSVAQHVLRRSPADVLVARAPQGGGTVPEGEPPDH